VSHRSGNADGLSRRPAAAEDDAVLVRESCSAAQEARDATEIVDGWAGEFPGAAGESLAN